MRLELILAIALSFGSLANAKSLVMKSGKNSVAIITRDGLRFSNDCLEKACDAYLATKDSKDNGEEKLIGNPAAHYCWYHGASSVTLKDPKGNEDSYCIFSDGSLINSWDLFYLFHPKSN